MSIIVSTIVSRAQETLNDTGTYWPVSELIDYLNAARGALVANKPDSNSLLINTTLTANTPIQTIPSDGFSFLDLPFNLNNSNIPVSAIRQIDKEHLNHFNPNWPTTTGSSIRHYMFDPRSPHIYLVYPIPTTALNVELLYSQMPPAVAQLTDTLPFDPVYEQALHYYVVGLALAKNTRRQDVQKVGMYMNLFSTFLGGKNQFQFKFYPTTDKSNAVPESTPSPPQ